MTRRIRFWDYVHCPVRIALAAGDSVRHCYSFDNGEGWTHVANVWTFDGDTVTLDHFSDGSDCDGRHSHHSISYFAADQHASGVIDSDSAGVVYPAWRAGESGQRDYSAEAMNY